MKHSREFTVDHNGSSVGTLAQPLGFPGFGTAVSTAPDLGTQEAQNGPGTGRVFRSKVRITLKSGPAAATSGRPAVSGAAPQGTGPPATSFREDIKTLFDRIRHLRAETAAASASAAAVLQDVPTGAQHYPDTNAASDRRNDSMASHAQVLQRISALVDTSTAGLQKAHQRVEHLITSSERLVQGTVAIGGHSTDGRFIDYVSGTARKIGHLFEAALDAGRITPQALFDNNYTKVPCTRPQQVICGFTALTDRILPPLLDAALDFDCRVTFCAAVDVNGYLPTHNTKFSQPQGSEPSWNSANCLNRRIFDDRTGLKAGRNTAPFLLQVCRHDMGGGTFAIMKDLSAPIFVRGRHWGALRMGLSLS